MRKLKFRAFYEGKMYFWGFGDIVDGSYFTGPINKPEAPQMQFTGLRDKNGKDIYEGDLLAYKGDMDALFEIFYNPDLAKFDNCRGHYKNGGCGGCIPVIYATRKEVVGNIYETPELLEAKKP